MHDRTIILQKHSRKNAKTTRWLTVYDVRVDILRPRSSRRAESGGLGSDLVNFQPSDTDPSPSQSSNQRQEVLALAEIPPAIIYTAPLRASKGKGK